MSKKYATPAAGLGSAKETEKFIAGTPDKSVRTARETKKGKTKGNEKIKNRKAY